MNSRTCCNSLPVEPSWREAGLRYYTYNHYFQQRFGERIQKVSLDAGFTCPNVDGTVALGGCTFCDNRSFSPSRRIPRQSIHDQIDDGIRRLQRRYANCRRFLAYFQPATNTYGPLEKLARVYHEALEHPKIVGLAIGTRPDCMPPEVIDFLAELARAHYLSVELGIQTIHDRSLRWMNRGHEFGIVPDVVHRCRHRGFQIAAHIMLGLPGESRDDMLQTATTIAELRLDAVKIHNLYVVRNTPLAEQFHRGEIRLLGRDEYVSLLVDFVERLPPETVVERVSGESPDPYFVAPSWCLDKPDVLRSVRAEFERRDTWQGRLWKPEG